MPPFHSGFCCSESFQVICGSQEHFMYRADDSFSAVVKPLQLIGLANLTQHVHVLVNVGGEIVKRREEPMGN